MRKQRHCDRPSSAGPDCHAGESRRAGEETAGARRDTVTERRCDDGHDHGDAHGRLATVWLGGCSGCHMSFLDLDERLIDLAARGDVVFSPAGGRQGLPEGVDVVLVEGAVANDENLAMIQHGAGRARAYWSSLGDCAVTGNVTALRNPLGLGAGGAAAGLPRERRRQRRHAGRDGASSRCCCAASCRCTR